MSVEQSTQNENADKTFRLIKGQTWEEIKNDHAEYSTRNRLVMIEPQDEWFDMTHGYPLKACEWLERQIAEGIVAPDLMIYSQYLMKVEKKRSANTFSHSYHPVSMHLWRMNQERVVIHLVFQGGFEGQGDSFSFTINNEKGNAVERFTPIPEPFGGRDENGYQLWYRTQKEVTRTLRFAPPAK